MEESEREQIPWPSAGAVPCLGMLKGATAWGKSESCKPSGQASSRESCPKNSAFNRRCLASKWRSCDLGQFSSFVLTEWLLSVQPFNEGIGVSAPKMGANELCTTQSVVKNSSCSVQEVYYLDT
jgi:hypothetical protein